MYSAKHWHAQLSQLTGIRRGDEALDTASLDVRPDTLIKWLSDPECNVRRSYRALIHTAYENVAFAPAEPLTDTVKNGQYKTSGLVKTGADNANAATGALPAAHRRQDTGMHGAGPRVLRDDYYDGARGRLAGERGVGEIPENTFRHVNIALVNEMAQDVIEQQPAYVVRRLQDGQQDG
ncbi:hypothetical protein AB0454_32910 [Streptomyces sp. NPDC093509]|uniref:hypothetical protein n=1 Tax=Streptomyces sp. NPDC093509 TaxID=3154982 RepID=UPI00345014B5